MKIILTRSIIFIYNQTEQASSKRISILRICYHYEMYTPFIILCLQTVVFWSIVVALYQLKQHKLTLIPLYTYIAILTIFMHNLTDLGFSVTIGGWFFLISSFSFFTALMFATLFLYLLEGPGAAKLSLLVILFSSFFYALVVYFVGLQTSVASWVQFDYSAASYYFWSGFTIVIDVIFMAFIWEVISRIRFLNLTTRVFIVMLTVFSLDSLIFVTGTFGNSPIYMTMLQGSIAVRFILSLIGAPITAYLLKSESFYEEKRDKPKKFWEIVNFRSGLGLEGKTLREYYAQQNEFWERMEKSEEKIQN